MGVSWGGEGEGGTGLLAVEARMAEAVEGCKLGGVSVHCNGQRPRGAPDTTRCSRARPLDRWVRGHRRHTCSQACN